MKDRLAALQAAQSSSNGNPDVNGTSNGTTNGNTNGAVAINVETLTVATSPQSPETRGLLGDYLKQCSEVRTEIMQLNTEIDKLSATHNTILFSPDLDAQQAEKQRNQADELSSSIRKRAAQVRAKVKVLESQIRQEQLKSHGGDKKGADGDPKRTSGSDRYRTSDGPEAGLNIDPGNQSAEMRIMVAQYSSVNHQFYEMYLRFNNEQRDYSEKCKDRLTKQIRIFDPAADDDQVEAMMVRGGNVFSSDLLAQTVEAKRQLADIEARHTEIVNLERSIRELHDMFMDVQMFVSEQGEVIDRIESAVEKANEYVEQGTEELTKAVHYKKAACKKKICIIGIVSAVVIVIVLVVVLSIVLTNR